MQALSSVANTEVVVLSDSEDEGSSFQLPAAGVSITISAERPLDPGLFLPSTSEHSVLASTTSSGDFDSQNNYLSGVDNEVT